MLDFIQALVPAIALLAATNPDDLVLLIFSFARPGCRPRQVVSGQLIGLAALTAVSFGAA